MPRKWKTKAMWQKAVVQKCKYNHPHHKRGETGVEFWVIVAPPRHFPILDNGNSPGYVTNLFYPELRGTEYETVKVAACCVELLAEFQEDVPRINFDERKAANA